MRGSPVAAAVRGGLSRRRVQTVVISLVVLISTAASTLALGLLVDSSAPFDHAFAAQRGAQLTAVVNPARATSAQLAASTRLAGVTAAAGPFAEATVTGKISMPGLGGDFLTPPITLAGRAAAGGPVDDVALDSGRWATHRGEVVISRDFGGPRLQLGQQITVTSVPGSPRLTVVGIGKSITDSADGWVTAGEIAALRVPGTPPAAQMLYRFQAAGSAAQVRADLATIKAVLPAGAVTGSQSYLTVRLDATGSIAPIVPFVVAFGIIGLVMSVLIVSNVVGGAVVAGYRRIGILKSIGFTPGQVVAAYVSQIGVSALTGAVAGVALGNVLSIPLLSKTANVYGVGALAVPVWVSVAVPAAVCVLVAIAALLPALRAGRLSAIQAIATGRAPRQHGGYAAHRLLGRLGLPRPVTIGLAAPFARPARTAVTLVAILFGAGSVTFAVGLSASLSKVAAALSHSVSEPVQITLSAGIQHVAPPGAGPPGSAPVPQSPAVQQRIVEQVLRTQPGTLHYVAETQQQIKVSGLSQQIPVHAFRGDATWTGYDLISGRWYHGEGEADVPTYFLTATGTAVGDTVTITAGGRPVPVRIVGEVFDTDNHGLVMLTDWRTLTAAVPGLTPTWYDVALRPGTDATAYVDAVGRTLGTNFGVNVNSNDPFFLTLVAMIGTLTLMLALVAGLGVLNTVVLSTRERVHDLGVFKALGMTPRQTISMVICWVAGTGLAAGLIAVPAGVALHHYIVPVMASSVGTGVPAMFLHVYPMVTLGELALSGFVIAVAGALLPASWAAKITTASALRAE
jgi:putative ABC transport system permease protein